MVRLEGTLSQWTLDGTSRLSLYASFRDLAALGLQRGDHQYYLGLEKLHRTAQHEDRPAMVACLHFLMQLNTAVLYLREVGTKETKELLKTDELINTLFPAPDAQLRKGEGPLWKEVQLTYVDLSQFQETLTRHHPAMKLVHLLDLLTTYSQRPEFTDFRGMIFVDTKQSTKLLRDKIETEPALTAYRCTPFVGHGKTELKDGGKFGQSSKEQTNLLAGFREGKYNLLIATSVAEEGLDVAECNLVIRYDTQFSATKIIQSRGRARRRDSRFVLILGRPAQQVFEETMRKEKNMYKVVERLMAVQAQGQTYLEVEDAIRVPRVDTSMYASNPKAALENYCRECKFEKPNYQTVCLSTLNQKRQEWRCTLLIPRVGEAPLDIKVLGESEKTVRKTAAMNACEKLAQEGRLMNCGRNTIAPTKTTRSYGQPANVTRVVNDEAARARALLTYDPVLWAGAPEPFTELLNHKDFVSMHYESIQSGIIAHLILRRKAGQTGGWENYAVSSPPHASRPTDAANTAALAFLQTQGVYYCRHPHPPAP